MTTRVFIKDYTLQDVRKKMIILKKYIRREELFTEIISSEGIFSVDNNKLYKIEPVDADITTYKVNETTTLLDNSYTKRELIFSQIPFTHTYFERVRLSFTMQPENLKSAFLTLIIEGNYADKNSYKETSNKDTSNKDTSKMDATCNKDLLNFIPTDMYFITKESFGNILLIKELNVFLSILK
uniref:Uncharacterized protein n=1 Tax=viral metagenome TaxID=1070528 RepID=A0A6C0B0T7_9ZZZZ